MHRKHLAALTVFVMAGCQATSADTETEAALTSSGASGFTSGSSGEDNASTSNAPDTSVVASTTTESTDSSTGGALAPDLTCKPTPLFCQQFNSWCPFAIDQASCDSVVTPCEEQTSLCTLCADVRDSCHVTWGAGSPLCDLGYQKCLAAAPVEGCGCQPAVFPCAASESDCEQGWLYQPNGGYCAPPCTPVSPYTESTGGFTTGDEAPMDSESTGVVVTGGVSGTSGSTETGDETTSGDPPPETESTCGPSYYSTCVAGFCAPHILVLCL